jgi:starch synthase
MTAADQIVRSVKKCLPWGPSTYDDWGLATLTQEQAARGPLFGLVSRLVHQKGVDFVLSAATAIISAGGQIVATGSGERQFESALQNLRQRYPDSVGVTEGFDEKAAPTMFAATDFTFIPSRFEPCGLSQMYAQRFGSLPIGYKTGGLAETIDDGKTGFFI